MSPGVRTMPAEIALPMAAEIPNHTPRTCSSRPRPFVTPVIPREEASGVSGNVRSQGSIRNYAMIMGARENASRKRLWRWRNVWGGFTAACRRSSTCPRRKIHGRERNGFEPSFESIPAGSAIAHRWCTHGESLIHAPARSGQFMCDRKRSTHVRAQAVDSSKRDLQSSPEENPGRFAGLPERCFRMVCDLPTMRLNRMTANSEVILADPIAPLLPDCRQTARFPVA